MKIFWAGLRLAVLAVLLGAMVGTIAAGFLHVVEWGQALLWEGWAVNLPGHALWLGLLGGLLVGLCQRYWGDHPKGINEAIAEMRATGRLDYTHLPQGLTTVLVSLLFGASLGPESAIVEIVGGLGTWVGEMFTKAREGLALPPPTAPHPQLRWVGANWPALIAVATGGLAFGRLVNGLYSGGLLNLNVDFQWSDLLWSLPLALVGATGGGLYLALQGWTRLWVAPLQKQPVVRGVVGGLVFGVVASFLPLVLFSGQHTLQPMYAEAAQLGGWVLLLTALARLLLTNLLLATGWKGGQFLPIMFAGAALGLALRAVFPALPAPAAVLAPMAALLAVVLPQPLLGLALMVGLFPLQYSGIPLVAVGVVLAGQRAWPWLAPRLRPYLPARVPVPIEDRKDV